VGEGGLKPSQATPTMWKMCECGMRTRFPGAESGRGEWGGGGNNAKPCRSLTDQHINGKLKTKIANTILLLFALTKCAYLLLVSFGTLWRPYIVGQSL
jgi:hypothetical protein